MLSLVIMNNYLSIEINDRRREMSCGPIHAPRATGPINSLTSWVCQLGREPVAYDFSLLDRIK